MDNALATATLVVTGALVVAPGSAQATPFPETWYADSSGHAFCFAGSGWTTPYRDVVYWAMDRLGQPTDMTTLLERNGPSPGACVSGSDIQWYVWNLPAGTRGQTRCADWTSSNVCNSAVVDMDFAELDKGTDDWYDRRKTAVHEIGHTVGLGHHSPSAHDCAMISGEVPSRDMKWRTYHSHDIGHINGRY
ncbi:hypothetical protein ACN28C_04560 [Plantactinospora sp. WMMC1484]|uniref:hypothetical protein n=1 Tax=Plantactinospora sp. WMMC1484 TaxID=3404122 RepID=UPI003BF5304A